MIVFMLKKEAGRKDKAKVGRIARVRTKVKRISQKNQRKKPINLSPTDKRRALLSLNKRKPHRKRE